VLVKPHPRREVVPTTKTHVDKIATCIVPVADVDGAIEFYTQKLGLEKRIDVPFGGQYRWVEVAPEGAETTVALAPPPEGKAAGKRETGISLYTKDIDGYHAELKADGVDVDDEVSRVGGPVPPLFWLRDPEGNTLMVVGDAD
jgi:catechol 2,3-dioxygenase-like lactoylglutathione lyase family enzyme